MRSMLETLDARLDRVEITRIEDGTFYADNTLSSAVGIRTIDGRPSDAVALASRVGAPIWVADDVLDEAGVPDTLGEADAEENLDEFHRFIEGVRPEDFSE
jgi:bifunctional DNase/RNase